MTPEQLAVPIEVTVTPGAVSVMVAGEHTLPVVTVTGGSVFVSVPAGGQLDGAADAVMVTGGAGGGQLGALQTPETVATDVTVDGTAGGQLGDGHDED